MLHKPSTPRLLWLGQPYRAGKGSVERAPVLPDSDCDVYDLLDQAYGLSLSVRLDPEKARALIERLRGCAARAAGARLSELQMQLLNAASDLEKRLTA